MNVFLQSVLAVFAAVGLFTVLHTIAELILSHLMQQNTAAELTLYGDGCDASSEKLLRLALYLRRHYLPHLSITFVELGGGCCGENIVRRLATQHNILYLD